MKRSGLIAAAAATLIVLGLHQDVGAASSASTASPNTAETYKELNLFGDVFELVRNDYADEVKDDQLIEGAINGMLTSLDPHSNYLNSKNFNDMKVQTRGEFGGLGIEVSMENGLVKVVSPIDDTPAAHAGLKPGDLITHLDGQPVQGLTLPEAVEKMRGPVNSDITLTLRREGQEPFDVKLTRAIIKIQSVTSHLEGNNIAYIRISSFNEQTDVGLNNAMKNLKQQGNSKLIGVILDLRNNPGGLLDQAVAVSDAFLEKGEIVSTRGKRPEEAQRYNARPGDIATGLPVAVLINGGSASASEIVAGALQDHHRAVLIGTKSFGKGSVQTIIPLAGHGAMRLTTARYYTPSGRSIQARGIDPDIVVDAAKIAKDEKPGNKTAKAGDKKDESAKKDDSAAEQGAVDPSVMGTADDYQLARAVDMLRGIALFNGRLVN
ncbi:MAG: S41 family peptidase [Alphaproteobacteria bacterium]|nr:S41 family peptidase [Alphaproteobacteria bacterium]MBV9154563.1 S41 family peptidase [Alphaproteobacteria bacterium]MBV9967376.1 S41 family peptidase [Alphaproteobacteria bacterium]